MEDKKVYENFMTEFLNENSKLNLISKNDEKFLWEKHILDSLAIDKFFKEFSYYPDGLKMLDIGTGGGFPAIPIAIKYPKLKVTALDSIKKKIDAVNKIKRILKLDNLEPICDRAENLNKKFEIVTSRAVASLDKILIYGLPLMKKNGYFVAYKSIKAQEEIVRSQRIVKKYNAKVVDVINYELPLEENHIRNLIVVKFC